MGLNGNWARGDKPDPAPRRTPLPHRVRLPPRELVGRCHLGKVGKWEPGLCDGRHDSTLINLVQWMTAPSAWISPLPRQSCLRIARAGQRIRIGEVRKVRTFRRSGPTSSGCKGSPIPAMRVTVLHWEGRKVRLPFPYSTRWRANAEGSYLRNFLSQAYRISVMVGSSYIRIASVSLERGCHSPVASLSPEGQVGTSHLNQLPSKIESGARTEEVGVGRSESRMHFSGQARAGPEAV